MNRKDAENTIAATDTAKGFKFTQNIGNMCLMMGLRQHLKDALFIIDQQKTWCNNMHRAFLGQANAKEDEIMALKYKHAAEIKPLQVKIEELEEQVYNLKNEAYGDDL